MSAAPSLKDLQGPFNPPEELAQLRVAECGRLHEMPLAALSPGDLHTLISEGIGLQHLMSLALARLEESPLQQVNTYAGDLLSSVLSAPTSFWSVNPLLRKRLLALKSGLDSTRNSLEQEWIPALVTIERAELDEQLRKENVSKVACTKCSTPILQRTSQKNGGLCFPCLRATKEEVKSRQPLTDRERFVRWLWALGALV